MLRMAGGKGRDSAGHVIMVAISLILGLLAVAPTVQAVDHVVSGPTGRWSLLTGTDKTYYQTWANNNTFLVGDVLVFNYTVGGHDVVEYIRKSEFDNCAGVAVQRWTSGADRIVLNSTGTFYYICSIPGHCETGGGMKLAVTTTIAVAPTPLDSGPLVAPAASPTAPSRSTAEQSSFQSVARLVAAAIFLAAASILQELQLT